MALVALAYLCPNIAQYHLFVVWGHEAWRSPGSPAPGTVPLQIPHRHGYSSIMAEPCPSLQPFNLLSKWDPVLQRPKDELSQSKPPGTFHGVKHTHSPLCLSNLLLQKANKEALLRVPRPAIMALGEGRKEILTLSSHLSIQKQTTKKREKLKPSESASLSPRRVIKAFWQSEVVFILVCVVLLL